MLPLPLPPLRSPRKHDPGGPTKTTYCLGLAMIDNQSCQCVLVYDVSVSLLMARRWNMPEIFHPLQGMHPLVQGSASKMDLWLPSARGSQPSESVQPLPTSTQFPWVS